MVGKGVHLSRQNYTGVQSTQDIRSADTGIESCDLILDVCVLHPGRELGIVFVTIHVYNLKDLAADWFWHKVGFQKRAY